MTIWEVAECDSCGKRRRMGPCGYICWWCQYFWLPIYFRGIWIGTARSWRRAHGRLYRYNQRLRYELAAHAFGNETNCKTCQDLWDEGAER